MRNVKLCLWCCCVPHCSISLFGAQSVCVCVGGFAGTVHCLLKILPLCLTVFLSEMVRELEHIQYIWP